MNNRSRVSSRFFFASLQNMQITPILYLTTSHLEVQNDMFIFFFKIVNHHFNSVVECKVLKKELLKKLRHN